MKEKNGEYARHGEIELIGMTDCGDCPGLSGIGRDCPGLVVPRVKPSSEIARNLGREIEETK
jgi:predicted metal-binding protein